MSSDEEFVVDDRAAPGLKQSERLRSPSRECFVEALRGPRQPILAAQCIAQAAARRLALPFALLDANVNLAPAALR
jgi:hypothetical protein